MPRAQLILYAIPTGLLAEQCDRLFRMVRAIAPTTAQTYPPHCTLTGFFHRPVHRVHEVIDAFERTCAEPAVRAAMADAGDRLVARRHVQALGVRRHPDWLGIELEAPVLRHVATVFAGELARSRRAGDDAIRLKDWLHLSLAYDCDAALLDRHTALAGAMLGDDLACEWQLGLWRRHLGGRWEQLPAPAVAISHG